MAYPTIKQSELQLGDLVRLFEGPFGDAKVIRISPARERSDTDMGSVTFFRPWLSEGDNGYPKIGVEIFDAYLESEKTVQLLQREWKEK